MKRLFLILALLCSLAFGQSATIDETYFGMTEHNFAANGFPTVSTKILRINNDQNPTNVKWLNINTASGVYSWTALDTTVLAYTNAGYDVIYTFDSAPDWTHPSCSPLSVCPCVSTDGPCWPPDDYATTNTAWKAFVTAMVSRYDGAHGHGRIKYYEIWNEPNSQTAGEGQFWYGGAGNNTQKDALAKMQCDAYPIIAAVSGNKVIQPAPQGSSADTFLDAYMTRVQLISAGVGNNLCADIVGYHGYVGTANLATMESTLSTSMIDGIVTSMGTHSVSSLPLWDTESSWGLDTDYPDWDKEASFVARHHLLEFSKGVKHASWWAWSDDTQGTLFTKPTGPICQAGTAWETMHDWIIGGQFTAACSVAGTVWSCPLTKANGASALIMWDTSKTFGGTGTCTSAGVPTTANQTVAATYGSYTPLKGTKTSILSNLVPVGLDPVLVEATPWYDLVASTRAIDWSASGVSGGIPYRTTICSTLTSTATVTSINSALSACPSGQVVKLNPGTYTINGQINIPSNVTLRGSGTQSTILNATGASSSAVVAMGTYGDTPTVGQSTNINSGATRSSTSIVVASAANISVGKFLLVTELNDPAYVTITTPNGTCTWCDNSMWSSTRVRGQIVEVTGVAGTTITISPGLYSDYGVAAGTSPAMATPFTASATLAGVEDLQVKANNSGYTANFAMTMCASCWIARVESNYADGDHVQMSFTFRNEVRDSYFTSAYSHTSGATDACIFFGGKASANRVENNILERLHSSVILNWGAAGNVISYNYSIGSFDSGATDAVMIDFDVHGAHPQFNLWEGNVTPHIFPDSFWGSGAYNTAFRNHTRGTTTIAPFADATYTGRKTINWAGAHLATQQIRGISISFPHTSYNLIGNISGSADAFTAAGGAGYNSGSSPYTSTRVAPGTRNYTGTFYGFDIGYDTGSDSTGSGVPTTPINFVGLANSTLFAHGNWDMSSTTTIWDAGTANHTLPPSFYLSAQPTFWQTAYGTPSYPAIGPDVTGGTVDTTRLAGHVNSIPAKKVYDGTAKGSDGLLLFNALAAYPFAVPSTPPCVAAVISSPLATSNAGGTAITFTWNTNVPADSMVAYSTGYVQISKAGTFTATTDTTGVVSHSVTVSGLHPNSLYNWGILSRPIVAGSACGPTYYARAGGPVFQAQPNVWNKTTSPAPAGTYDYWLGPIYGGHHVTQGYGIRLQIPVGRLVGTTANNTQKIVVSGLPNFSSVYWQDQQGLGQAGTRSTTTIANDTLLWFQAGTPPATEVYISTNVGGTTTPGTYTITVTSSGVGAGAGMPSHSITHSLVVDSSPFGIAFTPGTPASYPAIPHLSNYVADMTTYGTYNCAEDTVFPRTIRANDSANLTTVSGAIQRGAWYYDGVRVYNNISKYLGDYPTWDLCRANVKDVYWNRYVLPAIPIPGNVPRFTHFTVGAYQDYLRTGDVDDLAQIDALDKNTISASNGSMIDVGSYQRETVYALDSDISEYLLGRSQTRLGHNTAYWMAYHVDVLLGHVDQICLSQNANYWQAFMTGLLADALINYYENVSPDPRIPSGIKCLADYLYSNTWNTITSDQGAFPYDKYFQRLDFVNSSGQNLNMLVVPMYGWLFKMTGDSAYQTQGDAIWDKGVLLSALGGPNFLGSLNPVPNGNAGKNFSEHYMWSPSYVEWRTEPILTATATPALANFGNQTVNVASAAQVITYTNTGTGTSNIASINLTTGTQFSKTTTCGATVAPAASCTISLFFTPTSIGAKTDTLTITSDATNSPYTVALSGTGTLSIAAISPTTLPFGNQANGTSSSVQVATMINTGNVTLNITSVSTPSTSQFSRTTTCGATLAASASCTISGTFSPTTLGVKSATITITDDASDSPQTISLTGTSTGTSVEFAPLSLGFLNQLINTSTVQTVALTNLGGAVINISSISITGAEASSYSQTNDCGSVVAVSGSCTFTVTFTPVTVGGKNAAIQIVSDAPDSPQSIVLSGAGAIISDATQIKGVSGLGVVVK